ncbi:MAG TPA: heme-degrading domain-containing protein [Acidobacteriaceae bacterium]|jgi:uncharacterized protein (UPF0303 family)|nr:heme-degrading domain-containing protein [Acidobacteriaceae bacterium]
MALADDLARIALQERQLQFPAFNKDAAWRLGCHLRDLAVQRGLGVVIDIRRPMQPLFYTALQGTTADHADWIRRKSNVTLRFQRSSYALGLELEQKGSSLLDRYGLAITDYATHGGSFPIRVRHAGFVGAVTVSGLPQRGDHELVVEAICAAIGVEYATLRLT